MYRQLVALGVFLAAIGIVLGAFGAHGLREIAPPDRVEIFKTGVLYHIIHGVSLTVAACLGATGLIGPRVAKLTATLFIIGIAAFSGSLYLLALGGPWWLGPITPIGGLSFIAGWIVIGIGALRPATQPPH